MNAIEIKNMSKIFKKRTAVDNLSLNIKKGEMFALLGQNGAGKSTTIKMLSCLLSPTSGEADVMGLSIKTNAQKVKQMINVSPQETAIAPGLSVRENIELIARIYGLNNENVKKRTDELVAVFNLKDREKDKAKSLSGGMQRKLSIAMALVSNPEVLFLDEPTLGLDVRSRRELWETISELKVRKTIILTTHYLEEAEALADRIGIMCKGRIRAIGTAEEIMKTANEETFENAFLKLTNEEVTA